MQYSYPVPGVQIVERGRKIHEEKKNEGRLEEQATVQSILEMYAEESRKHVGQWNYRDNKVRLQILLQGKVQG